MNDSFGEILLDFFLFKVHGIEDGHKIEKMPIYNRFWFLFPVSFVLSIVNVSYTVQFSCRTEFHYRICCILLSERRFVSFDILLLFFRHSPSAVPLSFLRVGRHAVFIGACEECLPFSLSRPSSFNVNTPKINSSSTSYKIPVVKKNTYDIFFYIVSIFFFL